MNNLHHHLHTAAQERSLSAHEKGAMRRELLRTMRSTGVASPYFDALFFRGFAAFALILVVGSGAAFAAEGTVPGDILYNVKTSVTEPVRGILAVSDAQQASWNTSLVERRAIEAETLASEGRLSDADAAILTARLELSANAAQTAVDKVAAADPSDADALSVGLHSSLSAHGALIAELEDTSDERTKSAASSISDFFRGWGRRGSLAIAAKTAPAADTENAAPQATMAMTLSVAADTATASPSASDEPSTAPPERAKRRFGIESGSTTQMRASASRSLDAARDRFESLEGSLDESTAANIESRLARIEETLAGDADAQDLARAASDANALNTFLAASGKLNRRDLIAPAIEKWESNRGSRGSWNEGGD